MTAPDKRQARAGRATVGLRLPAALVALLALCLSDGAASQEFSILYHEPLPNLSLDQHSAERGANGLAVKPQPPERSFTAFGRRFDLLLEPNDRVKNALPVEIRERLGDVRAFRGTLDGMPGSWVSLTRRGQSVSGLIWDGAELYAIDPLSDVAPFLTTASDADPATPVIYRWSETVGTLTDQYRAVAAPSTRYPTAPRKELLTLVPPLARRLDIAFVADAAFVQLDPATVESRLLAIANSVDAIMLRNMGIQVNVAAVDIFADDSSALTASQPLELLNQLEQLKDQTPHLHAQGLAHLFTGRDLVEPASADDDIVGMANLGAVCEPRLGVGLTQATFGSALNALIAAHEIGHSFGAPHDGQPPCENTPGGYLMSAQISGSQSFSQCSIEQMQATLASATCLTPLPPSDLLLTLVEGPPPDVLVGETFVVTLGLESIGTDDVLGVRLYFDGDGVRTTRVTGLEDPDGRLHCAEPAPGGTPACSIDRIAEDRSFPVAVHAVATEPGPLLLEATVEASNDPDLSNNTVLIETAALPSIELRGVGGVAEPAVARPGEDVKIMLDIVNMGALTATGVSAAIIFPQNLLEPLNAELTGGSCKPEVKSETAVCRLDSLAPGQSTRLLLMARAREQPSLAPGVVTASSVEIRLSANEPNLAGSETESVSVAVTPVLADPTLTMSGPDQAGLHAFVDFELRVRNRGPDSIPGLDIAYSNPGLEIERVRHAGELPGSCETHPQRMQMHCSFGALDANAELAMTISGKAIAEGRFTALAQLSAAAYDSDAQDTRAGLDWTVYGAPATANRTSSGGSGAVNPGSLLALLAAAIAVVARTRSRPLAALRNSSVGGLSLVRPG